jgi:hypothetical protein
MLGGHLREVIVVRVWDIFDEDVNSHMWGVAITCGRGYPSSLWGAIWREMQVEWGIAGGGDMVKGRRGDSGLIMTFSQARGLGVLWVMSYGKWVTYALVRSYL